MADNNFTYNDFKNYIDVPRETFLYLEKYVSLLKKWQLKINLVSNNTIEEAWIRHIVDSVQLIPYIDKDDKIVDIGSGAGFPGMVLAIMGRDVTLVESDNRKSVFLQEVARVTDTKNVKIISERIEKLSLENYNVITARGFASVKNILNLLSPSMTGKHKLLLLKGRGAENEIAEARCNWTFDYKKFRSITGQEGNILAIENSLNIKELSHEQ